MYQQSIQMAAFKLGVIEAFLFKTQFHFFNENITTGTFVSLIP